MAIAPWQPHQEHVKEFQSLLMSAEWKPQYVGFIDPDYARVAAVNGWETAKTFEAFHRERLAEFPDDIKPVDGYMFGSHMGAYVRALDEAKDHFVKAKLAAYAKRGSGSEKTT